MPDRDPGRPEHRPDRLARDLRPHQRVRVRRDAVPQGAPRARSATQVDYLTADEEDEHVIAQANAPLNADDTFAEARVLVRRKGGEVEFIPADEVDYMDVSPRQMVSVATAMIPFLEHDDANRALMGSNMQRQAVPLLRSEAPLVGTGMEYRAAVDAGDVIIAEKAGVVEEVSADLITVTERRRHRARPTGSRSSAAPTRAPASTSARSSTRAQRIEAGQVIADGPAPTNGEMALGQQPARGVHAVGGPQLRGRDHPVSQRLVQDDVLSSIHIEEHEVDARDTKLGPEEITRDIPNVSEEVLADLDERGIIRIGADVVPGDILVGKVTPKGETELTPEERLLRAIFGEKAREVRDTSLKVPHGESGKVIGVKRLRPRRGRRAAARRQPAGPRLRRPEAQDHRRRQARRPARQQGRHLQDPPGRGHAVPRGRHPGRHRAQPARRARPHERRPGPRDPPRLGRQDRLEGRRASDGAGSSSLHGDRRRRGRARHERRDPVFDGAREEEITGLLGSTLPNRDGVQLIGETGKARLFDGRSGEPFPAPVSVGYIYILKLLHLVDDKIHARSTGPYSMITQQPLGGKAQFGGQRFGEMEVWALEAYGASYALQELLTIKSDDVLGRVKVYEAIVKGENIPEPGIPESFKVLIKEMQSLCLNVEVLSSDGMSIEMRETDEDVFRAAEELGIDLSRREPSSVEEV